MNLEPTGQRRQLLPAKDKLEYLKVLLELMLLLLALPWLVREIIRDPRGASRKAAKKHLGG